MEKEQFEKMMSSIKEKIEKEKQKLLEQEKELKIKKQVIEKMLNSDKHLNLKTILNQVNWLQISKNDAINMLETAVEVGLDNDLPLSQYQIIINSINPALKELEQTNNEVLEEIKNRITRLSNYNSVSNIKNNISSFEKDVFLIEDVDQVELAIVLCLMSCDDFQFQEEKEQVETKEKNEKYKDFKEKIEVYEKEFEITFEDLIKKFEQYSDYDMPQEQSQFYILYSEIGKLRSRFYANKVNINRLKGQVVRKNILKFYANFIESYNDIEKVLKELKEKIYEFEELCNSFFKEKKANEIEQKTIVETPQKEVVQEQIVEEKLPEEQKIIEKPVETKQEKVEYHPTEEQQEVIYRAVQIYNYIKELNNSTLNNFLPSLEECIRFAKETPLDNNIMTLEQIIETMKLVSPQEVDKQIFESEKQVEEELDYEDVGTHNIVLFLKNDSQEFCIDDDFQKMNNKVKMRTEKEFVDMIVKITNMDFSLIMNRIAKKLKGSDYPNVEKLNPRRIRRNDSRYSCVRLDVCKEMKDELVNMGYDNFKDVLLIGGVMGEKTNQDLIPLVKELNNNIGYIHQLQEMLQNPNTNVEIIKELIEESNDYYMSFVKKVRKGRV